MSNIKQKVDDLIEYLEINDISIYASIHGDLLLYDDKEECYVVAKDNYGALYALPPICDYTVEIVGELTDDD